MHFLIAAAHIECDDCHKRVEDEIYGTDFGESEKSQSLCLKCIYNKYEKFQKYFTYVLITKENEIIENKIWKYWKICNELDSFWRECYAEPL